MSTSDIKHYRAVVLSYLAISAFCGVFSYIYNCLGHGVLSFFMNFLFLPPFFFGIVLPAMVAVMKRKKGRTAFLFCYHGGVAAMTLYFLVRGILEIAKTTSPYVPVFLVISVTMFFISLIFTFSNRSMKN